MKSTIINSLVPKPLRLALTLRKLTRYSQTPEFQMVGRSTVETLIEIGGLQPDETVLEVGCGLGRIALPLAEYLTSGRYEGFDILEGEITWAAKHITSKHPNFRFQLARLHNKYYRSETAHRAADYRFAYEDSTFDFVFLTSVFTHMLRRDLEHYLSEITRVLKPRGRCLINYFLLSERVPEPRDRNHFAFAREGCRVFDDALPEWEVAYEEEDIRRLYKTQGLQIYEPIRYGFQDYVLAVKS